MAYSSDCSPNESDLHASPSRCASYSTRLEGELDSASIGRGSNSPRAALLKIVRSGRRSGPQAWTAGDPSGVGVSRFGGGWSVTDQAREHLARVLDCAT